jgi:dTDP-4-dehydrorhamnose 3,5-epimerase
MAQEAGLLGRATRDRQSITADWTPVRQLIDGVTVVEIRSVPRRGGVLTEVFRQDWLEHHKIAQVFQVMLSPGTLSAWHAHRHTTDRLFLASGSVTLAVFDSRSESPTAGLVNELHLSIARPQLVVIPPGVWHGIIASGSEPALVLNLPDRAYAYEEPDHWRLPPDTPEIPYRFAVPDGPGVHADVLA